MSRLSSAVLVGALCVGGLTVVACSSLPDVTFVDDAIDGGHPEGAAADAADAGETDGDAGLGCSCETLPVGWTSVIFATSLQRSCPSNTSATDLRAVNGDGTPSCSCSCKDVGGSCGTGNFTLTLTGEATCGVTPSTAPVPTDVAACSALGASINVSTGAFAKIAHAGPASCSATAALTNAITDSRLCTFAPSSACGADQACVPPSVSGFQACVVKSGTNACPVGYSNRNTAGTTVDPSQACLGCMCGAPSACVGGSVSVYDGSMCKTMGSISHGATNIGTSCAVTSDSNFTATHFKSTPPAGGCNAVPTTQPASGTLTFTDLRTVCCK